jgi:hypothetical protein
VVATALRTQVALLSVAVGVRNGVVDVAVDRLGVAGGRGAQLVAGSDQVLELAAGDVAVLGVPVVARVPRDGFERDIQPSEKAE